MPLPTTKELHARGQCGRQESQRRWARASEGSKQEILLLEGLPCLPYAPNAEGSDSSFTPNFPSLLRFFQIQEFNKYSPKNM